LTPYGPLAEAERSLLKRLSLTSTLDNEGWSHVRHDSQWTGSGDNVDVTLLVMAHKAGVIRPDALANHSQISQLPFGSERQFSAPFHKSENEIQAFVKGAPENILRVCKSMAGPEGVNAPGCPSLWKDTG
jgi:Ca2+-transporting ATPase